MLSFFPDDAFYQPSKCWQVDLHRDSRSRYLWLKLEEAYGQSHQSPQAWVTKVLLSACSTQVKSKVPKSLMSSHINCFLDSKISYWKVFLCCALIVWKGQICELLSILGKAEMGTCFHLLVFAMGYCNEASRSWQRLYAKSLNQKISPHILSHLRSAIP